MSVIKSYYNKKACTTLFTFLLATLIFVINPLQSKAQTYSGPLVITKGGTYSGNWQSTNTEIPAVEVNTSEPVIIINSNIRGAGPLIRSWAQSANLTVRNTNGYGISPTPYKNYKKPRRFLTVDNFQNVVVENCYLESTAGIYVGVRYEGNGTTSNTIKIRYNKVKNIDGRLYGGERDLVQFVQFNFSGQIPHAEVAWNQVINEPNESLVEDNISMHNVKGTSGSPIRIHNNYIQGAYPIPATATSYSGGGILIESTSDLNASTSYIDASENHLVNFGNHGMGIAGGNNIRFHHNRLINSALFEDGTRFNMYTGGLWSRDYYHNGSTFSNSIDNNTLGVMGWNWPNDRNDYSIKEGATFSNNTSLAGVISLQTEQAEFDIWMSKLSRNGIVLGPNGTIAPVTPITPTEPKGTGKITLERWAGVSGTGVNVIPTTTAPTSTAEISLFEAPIDIADNYGQRIHGFITAPSSGDYTFWISGDDHAELWLSTSEDPSKKVQLASLDYWTNPREWTKYSSQKSAKVRLEAGKRYYIEALGKEKIGGDNLAVGWQLPNGTFERPIAGMRLSPFKSTTTAAHYTVAATATTGGTVAISSAKATYTEGDEVTIAATPHTGYQFSGWSGSASGNTNPLMLTVSRNISVTANFTKLPSNTTSSTGKITREYWANVRGASVSDIPVNTQPDATSELSSFEAPSDVADSYGQRIRGYVTAPATGDYTFWIAGDNDAELLLSTSEDPARKVRIASVDGWTREREWSKYSSQKSVRIRLEAGKRYYIEALHKEELAGDNLAVGWQLPNGSMERPIAGNRLSTLGSTTTETAPVATTPTSTATGKITREYWANVRGASVSDIPVNTQPDATSELSSFEAPSDVADSYGQRIRGYVTAPATGDYTFWIAGDNDAELLLSTSEDPARKVRIASVDGWTDAREWSKHSSQKSVRIRLEAGKRYYIEALAKEEVGHDNLAVGWQLPNGSMERPIGGNRLSPVALVYSNSSSITSSAEAVPTLLQNTEVAAYPNPFQDVITLDFGSQQQELQEVVVYDQTGKAIYKNSGSDLQLTNNKLELRLLNGNLKAGIYVLKYVDTQGNSNSMKLLKTK